MDVYPEVGWDPIRQQLDDNRVMAGEEKVVRNGNEVEIFMTAVRSHFTPERIELREGDRVRLPGTTCLPDRRHVVDVDTQTDH